MLQFQGWPHDPGSTRSAAAIIDATLEDADALARAGYTSFILQNLGSSVGLARGERRGARVDDRVGQRWSADSNQASCLA